jgi:type II pantothenate kinase
MSPETESVEEVGLDLGATLAKAVVISAGAPLGLFESHLWPSTNLEAVMALLASLRSPRIAATGAGAHRLATALGPSVKVVQAGEFEAWGAGERTLLEKADFVPTSPHLLVSLGTGTSILRVGEDGRVTRVGGTGLGGGTLRGFGELLLAESDHATLATLAFGGDRRRIDLLVSDIYEKNEVPLAGDLTAANLGRVRSREPRDVANAITGLIGENVGLLAAALARNERRPDPIDVVYAGGTLSKNVSLRDVLTFATSIGGARARFLPHGEFVGALGALATARAAAG